ncbi:MAG: hypothetical protein AABY03_00455 [Nanoarchaeota archaeon]
MTDNFGDRKYVTYEKRKYLERYDEEPEEYLIPFKITHLVLVDGTINGISHPFVAGLVRKVNMLKNGNIIVSEIFPCIVGTKDDEATEARRVILKEMERRKIKLTGSDFYFMNSESGNTRVYSTKRSGYSVA